MMYLGTFGNSHYYKKLGGDVTYSAAKAFVESKGGTLPIITSAEEDAFLFSVAEGQYWLGLSDVAQEGNFVWNNGAPLTYSNWNTNEPNDYGSGEDFVHVISNGKWNDHNENAYNWAVMELPCAAVTPGCGSSTTLGNLIYLGEYNDSRYYCTHRNNYTWHQHRDLAASVGGHLATVKSQGENDYIQNTMLAEYVWIG